MAKRREDGKSHGLRVVIVVVVAFYSTNNVAAGLQETFRRVLMLGRCKRVLIKVKLHSNWESFEGETGVVTWRDGKHLSQANCWLVVACLSDCR